MALLWGRVGVSNAEKKMREFWGRAEVFANKLQKRALEETKNVIPGLREKITNAREKLESVLVGFLLE
jgi:hypothetical protein